MPSTQANWTSRFALLAIATALAGCSGEPVDGANAKAGQRGRDGVASGDGSQSAQQVYESLVRDDRSTITIETSSPNEVVAPQDQGMGYVDPSTGKIAWRAFVCRNATCAESGGLPRPFTVAVPGASVDAGGNLVLPATDKIEAHMRANLRCPTCGRFEQLEQYEPPHVAKRRAELKNELAAARQARSDDALDTSAHRTPAEIMYEISTLPKLYLLSDNQ